MHVGYIVRAVVLPRGEHPRGSALCLTGKLGFAVDKLKCWKNVVNMILPYVVYLFNNNIFNIDLISCNRVN